MARPHREGADKRELTIRVRVTSAEKLRIWQLAAESGQTPSDYLRLKAVGTLPTRRVPTPDREPLLKLLAELGKIGSNVNQIAHALNHFRASGQLARVDPRDIVKTLSALDKLNARVLQLLEHGHSR